VALVQASHVRLLRQSPCKNVTAKLTEHPFTSLSRELTKARDFVSLGKGCESLHGPVPRVRRFLARTRLFVGERPKFRLSVEEW
jgi:hypothetical protein